MGDTGHTRAVEILTADEVRRIMGQCSRKAPTGIRDRALIGVMYRTGLRLEETLALRPVDVDHDTGTVRVLHGKGDQARTVGIDDATLGLVGLWMAERKRLGINGRAPLFCTLAGDKMSDRAVRYMVKRRADEKHADIGKRVHPHAFRHAYAFDLHDEGIPVGDIQKALGHEHLQTTAIYLDHIAPARVIAIGRARTWDPGE